MTPFFFGFVIPFILFVVYPQLNKSYSPNQDQMTTTSGFLSAIVSRRSIYALTSSLPGGVSQAGVVELVAAAIAETPTSFNLQSGRAVVLFGEESGKVWSLVGDKLRAMQEGKGEDQSMIEKTQQRIASFDAGVGTILFFEDQAPIQEGMEKYSSYAEQFPQWSEQSSGILQSYVWTLLASKQIGASLQHYSNLIEPEILETFDLPTTWKLKAQMPFGGIEKEASSKSVKPVKGERVLVFGQSDAGSA